MQLGRIRRSADQPVEVVVNDPERGVLSLAAVLTEDHPDIADDPVALLDRIGVTGLAGLLGRAEEIPDPTELIFEVPVARCSKVCCMALNYVAHAEESKLEVPPEPVLFLKPPSALIGHGRTIRPPRRTRHVEHEVEVAVVIGRRCRDVAEADWESVVAGYTIVNDLTARDLQLINHERNVPWDQAKGFDGFAPLGPWLVTADEVADPGELTMRLEVAGQVRQQAHTSQMVFGVPALIADLTDGMTLEPGDVIATGTTAGIAPLADGDVMEATVTGFGTLVNPISFAAH